MTGYSVTSCQVPRMAVVVSSSAPDEGGVLSLPPSDALKDKRYAILVDPSDGVARYVNITGGGGAAAANLGYDSSEVLVAEVAVPRGTTAIMNCHILRKLVPAETPPPEPVRQLVVEFMDGEFRFYKLEGEASWAEKPSGLVWREKRGASRTHIPWQNIRTYSLDLPPRDPDDA